MSERASGLVPEILERVAAATVAYSFAGTANLWGVGVFTRSRRQLSGGGELEAGWLRWILVEHHKDIVRQVLEIICKVGARKRKYVLYAKEA